jgi:hypothetical protein
MDYRLWAMHIAQKKKKLLCGGFIELTFLKKNDMLFIFYFLKINCLLWVTKCYLPTNFQPSKISG